MGRIKLQVGLVLLSGLCQLAAIGTSAGHLLNSSRTSFLRIDISFARSIVSKALDMSRPKMYLCAHIMSAVERPLLNPACDAARYASTLPRIRCSTMRDKIFRRRVRSTMGRRLIYIYIYICIYMYIYIS